LKCIKSKFEYSDDFSVDATVLRVDDIYQRETQNRIVLQNLDWRLQSLENLSMNMYNMIEKMFYNQSADEQDLPFIFHRRSYDDVRHQQRRPSSLTAYELSNYKDKTLSKSTIIPNRTSMPDPISLSKTSNKLQRRSTIHRLNSSNSNESNTTRIQSNEYTSITDGLMILGFFFLISHDILFLLVIDRTYHQWQPISPIVNRPTTITDDSTAKEEITAAYDAEEQTHNLIGEIIRKRARKSSGNQAYISTEPYDDSDRASLLSMDINTSSSNLNLAIPDAKN
jgi:hypothetical protein